MHPALWREIWILLGIYVASLVLGLFTGRFLLMAAIGFGLYVISLLRHLYRLHQWLLNRRQGELPEAGGMWGEVFDALQRMTKQNTRRENQLTGQLTRFQDAASAMPDAVVILSQEGDIEWANPSADRLLGIHIPRDTGMRIANLLRDPDFARYLQSDVYAEPIEINSPENPDLHISLQITPYGSRQKLILGRDITRVVRLEQMRRHFVANVSHELRTPLTVLGGFVETLRQMDPIEPKDLQKYLTTMHEQSVRMQRLVDDLLTLSRLETAPPRLHDDVVDVVALLTSLKEQAHLLSGKQHHAITLETERALALRGSREELHSAFSNLINNAVRYTPKGGAIHLRWQADHGGAQFSVTDSGEGIAAEHLPYLTERFYRVDSARSRASGGTGLGLSIVKHVLARHDAELHVESELDKGSTFSCVFPPNRIELVSI